jgi:hypothetical protein
MSSLSSIPNFGQAVGFLPLPYLSPSDNFGLENLSVWQISVFCYGLLILKRWKNSVGHI